MEGVIAGELRVDAATAAAASASDDDWGSSSEDEGEGTDPVVRGDPLLIPPQKFAHVFPGIFRSGYPHRRNLAFLTTMGIRSVLCLSTESHAESSNREFLRDHGIRLFDIGLKGNCEPFQSIPVDRFAEALNVLLGMYACAFRWVGAAFWP